jgi:hypothetical protein
MYNNQTTVNLAIKLHGTTARHGVYSHYHRVEKDGSETNGVRLERAPVYCESYKTVKLGTEFVKCALAEPPNHMKTMRPHIWKRFPENKRIAIHVKSYVEATHPENRDYTMEIL